MNGPAGVGKSAVAQTCVEKLKRRGKLGAAFFFSVNGRNKSAQFFTTVAYQLSIEFPDYRDLLDKRIRRDKTMVHKTMASQFRGLIIEPLQELERNGKGIGERIPIFIDGLDECEGADAQCEIVEIISAAAREGASPFCWAFFSRLEPHIEAIFTRDDIAKLCHKTTLPISRAADGEIELYLRIGFENILRRRNISARSRWPSDNDIKALVDAAAGLFVYPATLLRLVAHPGTFPEESLRAILACTSGRDSKSNAGTTPKSPFKELDAIYTLTLQRIPSEMLLPILRFCAMLCHSGLHVGRAGKGALIQSNLLGLSELEFKAICNQLSAVLHFHDHAEPLRFSRTIDTTRSFQYASPEAIQEFRIVRSRLGGSISFYHKSFYDFLVDPTRSGAFCVTSPAMLDVLFEHCLELQLKYEESYCFRGSGESLSVNLISYPHA